MFAKSSDAMIFVVNASYDQSWSRGTREDLHVLLTEDGLIEKSILIFASMMDKKDAMTVSEVKEMLGLDEFERRVEENQTQLASGRDKSKRGGYPHWMLIGCSAETGEGIQEGMDWLVERALERRQRLEISTP